MNDMYTNLLNTSQKLRVAQRLAEIEAEDREICAHCEGLDCICCEIYQDRQKWLPPEEFFSNENWDDWDCEEHVDWVYDEEEWLTIPLENLGLSSHIPTTNEILNAIINFIREDINNPEAKFEFDYKINPKEQNVEVYNIFYIYD